MPDENKTNDWLYYYALYHMLAHWYAMMATLGLLIGVSVATLSGEGPPHRMVAVPIVVIYLASVWFNYRLYVFSDFVNREIGPAVTALWSLRFPNSQWLAFGISTALLVLNFWVFTG